MKDRSEAPARSPSGFETLADVIDRFGEHGERTAILAVGAKDDGRWTYGALAERVHRLAGGITGADVAQGAAVALLANNRPEWTIACLAILKAGAAVMPLDVQLGDATLGKILEHSGVRLIFTTSDQRRRLEALDGGAGRKIVPLDSDAGQDSGWCALASDPPDTLPQVAPQDPAALFYTSGTTGPPKGVPLTHANIAFQLNALLEAGFVRADDRVLLPLPFHHVYPFVVGMLAPLALGVPVVMPRALTGPQIVAALREGEATLVIGVPRLYSTMFSGIRGQFEGRGRIAAALFDAAVEASTWSRRRLGLSTGRMLFRAVHNRIGPRLRVLVSGGAALDPELAWRLQGLGWEVASGYGLTETAPMLTWNLPGKGKLESAGRPVPGVEIRIDPATYPDENGDSTAPSPNDGKHEVGEVLAKGPNVFGGYRDLPDETGRAITRDGWFRTGDLGFLDDDNYLHLLGRASTLIVTEGGKNIQPDDVESAYLEDPAIREIAVLQQNGKLVALVLPDPNAIRRGGQGDIDAAVREAIRKQGQQLPAYKRLADYAVIRDPLPRTRLGKPRRHLLGEIYDSAKKRGDKPFQDEVGPVPLEKMAAEDRALLDNPVARDVWEWLAKRFSDQRLAPDTSLQLDLGVDSLEWMNLTLEIGQRAGVELGEEAIARIDTVRDLLQEVAEASESAAGAPKAGPLDAPEENLSERQRRWLAPIGPVASLFRRILFLVNWIVMRGAFRLRAHGLEHLPKADHFVLTPTHGSYLDPFAIAAALGYGWLRDTYWGGWTGVAFGNPLTRAFSRLSQVVPIEPERGAISSLAFGAVVLKRHKNLIWFPEGGRSPTGELQPFKPGLGMLLERFPAPVVPVVIRGAHEALPPDRAWPRFSPIEVTFGTPLDPGELGREGEGSGATERIVAALHRRMGKMIEDARTASGGR